MTVRRAAFSLGSNMGDRLGHLQSGIDGLTDAPEVRLVAVSSVYATDPVGGPAQPEYLNAVVTVDTEADPAELLALLRRVEAAAGRTRELRWGPRTLDVDLLAVGSLTVDTEELTLPHPRAHERAFVLCPWAEVDAGFVLVGHGPVGDLRARVGDVGVRVTGWRLAVPV